MHQSSSHKSLSLSLLAFIASLTLNLAAPAGAQAVCGLPPAGDADCDGMVDALDPCPSDTLNRCSGGTIATCETAPPGDQDCTAGRRVGASRWPPRTWKPMCGWAFGLPSPTGPDTLPQDWRST